MSQHKHPLEMVSKIIAIRHAGADDVLPLGLQLLDDVGKGDPCLLCANVHQLFASLLDGVACACQAPESVSVPT